MLIAKLLFDGMLTTTIMVIIYLSIYPTFTGMLCLAQTLMYTMPYVFSLFVRVLHTDLRISVLSSSRFIVGSQLRLEDFLGLFCLVRLGCGCVNTAYCLARAHNAPHEDGKDSVILAGKAEIRNTRLGLSEPPCQIAQ